MEIYVQRQGQQTGPFPLEQIRHELATGALRTTDMAWYEGAPGWVPLSFVPGLAAGAPPFAPQPMYGGPMPGQPYGGMPPQRPTSGLAVAALVLGILTLFTAGLTSLPAVICGHLGLSRIKRSNGAVGGTGLAITGLVMGYVMMLFFVGMIVGIALPVFNSVAIKGKQTRCLAQAKQVGLACKLYASDHDGKFPPTLDDLMPDYLLDKKLLVCPLNDEKTGNGYEYFGGTDTDEPDKILLMSKDHSPDHKRVVIHVDNSGELRRD